MEASYSYVSASELQDYITQGRAVGVETGGWAVVDVRDEDFDSMGGHIPGACHIASDDFEDYDAVDLFVQRVLEARPARVIFHCTMSQVRGPTCAGRFSERLKAALEPDADDNAEDGDHDREAEELVLDAAEEEAGGDAEEASGEEAAAGGEEQEDDGAAEEEAGPPQVMVLQGGFRRWSSLAQGDPRFVVRG